MSFQKMKWINVPDPNNMPTIDDIPNRPEYQTVVPVLDADTMDRIEEGVYNNTIKIESLLGSDVLKNIDKHCWKRQELEFKTIVDTSSQGVYIYDSIDPTIQTTLYYADSVSAVIDYDTQKLKVILNNPKTLTFSWNDYTKSLSVVYEHCLTPIEGKYWSKASDGSEPVFYSKTNTYADEYLVRVSTLAVRGVIVSTGSERYIYDENENKYPNGEIVDNYQYTYVGITRESLSLLKIASGSYVGTGTYGAANENKLVFDRVPDVIFFLKKFPNEKVGFGFLFPKLGYGYSGSGVEVLHARTVNNTVYWYSSSASLQLNDSNSVINYIGIG